jgi:hypothetical protein
LSTATHNEVEGHETACRLYALEATAKLNKRASTTVTARFRILAPA